MKHTKCKHCGVTIDCYEESCMSISRMLCEKCWKEWLVFHERNHDKLKQQYPNSGNAGWYVFSKDYKRIRKLPPLETFIFR
jgi:hypothetical protein